jgi:glutaminyl-tRNA synthetase
VRLRYGYVTECTGYDKDENGKVIAVHCNYFPDSKSGTPAAPTTRSRATSHWVSAPTALRRSAPVRPPVHRPQPDAGGKDFKLALNPNAKEVVQAYLEPGAERPSRKSATSSSATATSSPTASTASQAAGVQPHRHPEGQLQAAK